MKIIGIPEEEERNKGMEILFTQIVGEDFPNPWKEPALASKKQQNKELPQKKEVFSKAYCIKTVKY